MVRQFQKRKEARKYGDVSEKKLKEGAGTGENDDGFQYLGSDVKVIVEGILEDFFTSIGL